MRWKRPLLKTLDAYVLKRFLVTYGACFVSFTSIFILIDTVVHRDRFTSPQGGVGAWIAAWFQFYSAITPIIFCQILGPVVSVCGALFAVTTLQRSNEFIPVLATGRSYQRTILPILVASLFISLGVFLVQELWIPRTVSAVRRAVEAMEGRDVEENVKHLDRVNGNLIVFKEYKRYERKASGVLVLPVVVKEGRKRLIQAWSAEWKTVEFKEKGGEKGYWLLHDGSIQEWDENYRLVIYPPPPERPGDPPRLMRKFGVYKLKSNLIPEDLQRRETAHMSLGDLRRKAEKSPEQHVWRIRYFSRFAYAGTNFMLVLLGIPIVVSFGNRNMLLGALLAVGICTAYFVVNSICQDFGVRGHISAALGGGLGPLLFLSLGVTTYRYMRS